MTLNNLEPPLSKRVLGKFFVIFGCAAHYFQKMNCNEMAGDKPKQPAYKIFSIKR